MNTLIQATEAKKRSETFDRNYSTNKIERVQEAINTALRAIDQRIKLSTNLGRRSISYIGDEESFESLNQALLENGYIVTPRFIGGNRVKYSIKW